MAKNETKLRIIPLGGLGEIGKNITVIEYGEDIIVVDCGLAFPEEEMLGIDLVIPDVSYLVKNQSKIKALILTHGHEDHIGAVPYVLKQVSMPVYGTRLTLGLLEIKLTEHGLMESTVLNVAEFGEVFKFGVFSVEFIPTSHSIADSAALAIKTPAGTIVHTSDFRIDFKPVKGRMTDLTRFAELGKEGVTLLLCDSTNIERPGYTMSESTVGESFDRIFMDAGGRILVATFSSNIHRVQQIINSAVRFDRKVVLCGRSIINVVGVAEKLGYMNIPEGTMVDIDRIKDYTPEKLLIITTGSQGEPMSALSRIASSDHRKVEIQNGDLVIISASPIPGNEKTISRLINDLFRKGAEVIYEALDDIHVSGHACMEELKLMHKLVKPKYFMPVHGEYRHLVRHAKLACDMGMAREDVFIPDIGQVLEIGTEHAAIKGRVPAGKVLVDGLGVGDVGNVVLRDRKHLSQDGLVVVVVTIESGTGKVIAGPDIISRGFIYMKDSDDLVDELKILVLEALETDSGREGSWHSRNVLIKDILRDYLYEKTKRKPMIIPVITEI